MIYPVCPLNGLDRVMDISAGRHTKQVKIISAIFQNIATMRKHMSWRLTPVTQKRIL